MKKAMEKATLSTLQGLGRFMGPVQVYSSLPLISLSLGLAAWIVSLVPMAEELLQYDRAAIAGGEIWRVVTGHWTHWNGEHLLWDVIVFIGLGIACETAGRRSYLWCIAAGGPLISLVVWSALPEMQYYRGLSGLDAALYMLAGVTLLKEGQFSGRAKRAAIFLLLLAALGAKVGYEMLFGRTIFVQDMGGYVPVPIAHLAGALAGSAAAFLPLRSFSLSSRRSSPFGQVPTASETEEAA